MEKDRKGFLEQINGFQRFIGVINDIQQLYQKLSWKKLLFRFSKEFFAENKREKGERMSIKRIETTIVRAIEARQNPFHTCIEGHISPMGI